jgi:predicted GH43/DUF377 family glycosyl hydrolase
MNIRKNTLRFYASAKAVITQFLTLPGNNRVEHVIMRLDMLNENEVADLMNQIMQEFGGRHRNIKQIFLSHASRTEKKYGRSLSHLSAEKRLLLGAFFTKEYSIEAAALFNPSMVPHPDQSKLNPGEKRFVMSLRATGEGHISSIVFHTGTVDMQGIIKLDPSSGYHDRLHKKEDALYEKNFILNYAVLIPGFKTAILDTLPDSFTERQAKNLLTSSPGIDQTMVYSARILEEFLDMNYELNSAQAIPINEQVIFPNAAGESMGMEDVRFVKFEDALGVCYYGTYTAYNGKQIRTQLIETKNFEQYKVRTLNGPAVSDKGMALFPEKVNGKYAMISRQGGENINIMFSDDLYCWKKFHVLMEPRYPWEFVQLGNCGSPVRTEKGWLLLTHGVGAMRKYVISAILLDLLDPTRIIGRLDKPLIEADESEREGYVPNVVYTCGFMQHGDLLIIPYAVSDSATGFVTIPLNDLLSEFKL